MSRFLILAKPEDAEAAFYHAFAQADLALMLRIWDQTPDVACIHPMGRALHGASAVAGSWREILAGERPMHIQAKTIQWHAGSDLAVSLVEEVVSVQGEASPRPIILATNAYRLTADGWRMILHQASPAVLRLGEDEVRQRVH